MANTISSQRCDVQFSLSLSPEHFLTHFFFYLFAWKFELLLCHPELTSHKMHCCELPVPSSPNSKMWCWVPFFFSSHTDSHHKFHHSSIDETTLHLEETCSASLLLQIQATQMKRKKSTLLSPTIPARVSALSASFLNCILMQMWFHCDKQKSCDAIGNFSGSFVLTGPIAVWNDSRNPNHSTLQLSCKQNFAMSVICWNDPKWPKCIFCPVKSFLALQF